MKILNINRFYYHKGGADLYFFQLTDILQNKGHTIIPFSTVLDKNLPSDYSGYFVDGYSEETFPSLGLVKKSNVFLNGIYSLKAKKKLEQLIIRESPDIGHIHGIFYQLSLSMIDALKEKRIPIVMSLNDYFILCANGYLYRNGHICELCKGGRFAPILFHKCYRNSFPASLMAYFVKKMQAYRKMLNLIDIFLAPTEGVKDIMVDWGVDRNKVSVIHNPFDASKYEPSYVFDDYIIFYGRMARQKGIFTLLKAMKLLKDIKLKMFGSGPDLPEAFRYIKENHLTNVEISPHLPWGDKLIKIISRARFIVSCPEWYEPGSFVILESFSLGKPVVASSIAGNNSLVKDGYNGIFFEPGNADSLAEQIRKLYYNEALIVELGKNGRSLVENELNREKFYEKLLKVYEGTISKNE